MSWPIPKFLHKAFAQFLIGSRGSGHGPCISFPTKGVGHFHPVLQEKREASNREAQLRGDLEPTGSVREQRVQRALPFSKRPLTCTTNQIFPS